METFSKGKGILGLVAIFVVGMFLYNLFFKPESASIVSSLDSTGAGNELIKIRQELQAVTFDQTLFTSPGFVNLIDFSTAITPQPTGRSNPFNTIGRD